MKQRVLIVTAAFIACAAAVMWVAQGAGEAGSSVSSGSSDRVDATDLAPSPHPSATDPSTSIPAVGAELVSYSIPTTELQGLPPDIASGTRLDLWVTWQPPITKQAELRRLLRGVLLEKIVPPLLPDGPHSAILLVDPDQVSDLIWSDRFGALNVVVPPAGRG